jgi:23S rRNA (cytidine1920-2'-O)/16S rRNA (cytidine1409-2'-O)-methyltransferase
MTAGVGPSRLDAVLVARGLARSRGRAHDLITAGQVTVNDVVITKPAYPIEDDVIEVATDPWVSRAAHKLLGALEETGVQVPDRVLDAGASTGGFTHVLLARGARRVYAVDVGHGQLAEELVNDPRVMSREGLNLRDLVLADVDGEPVGMVVADVSFISLRLLLEPLLSVLDPDGTALLLVKPQFEVGKGALGAAGVVRSPVARQRAVDEVAAVAAQLGWSERWRGQSRLPGPAGNVEWFLELRRVDVVSG